MGMDPFGEVASVATAPSVPSARVVNKRPKDPLADVPAITEEERETLATSVPLAFADPDIAKDHLEIVRALQKRALRLARLAEDDPKDSERDAVVLELLGPTYLRPLTARMVQVKDGGGKRGRPRRSGLVSDLVGSARRELAGRDD